MNRKEVCEYAEKVDAMDPEDWEFVRSELVWLEEWISERPQPLRAIMKSGDS